MKGRKPRQKKREKRSKNEKQKPKKRLKTKMIKEYQPRARERSRKSGGEEN